MRLPSVRNPRSIWDIFAVLVGYIIFEYIVLQITGSFVVQQELIIVAIVLAFWTMWAILQILSGPSQSNLRVR